MWLVFSKEIKELLRDRKTLFFMIALPILVFPLIFGGMAYFTTQAFAKAENKVLKYGVVNSQYSAQISAEFSASELFEQVNIDANDDYAELIKNDRVDFVIVLPDNDGADILTSGQLAINLYLNDAGLNLIYNRVNSIIEKYAIQYQQAAFAHLNVSPDQQVALLKPIVLSKVSTADQRESWGEKIGGMLPYLLFILCFQGAMFPATDIAAGEKERGTLETLLISPIDRTKIVLGKFLTIACAGATTALITVLSMAIWGLVLSRGFAMQFVADFMSQIGVLDFVLMFLMLIPLVAIFASVLLSISIYARSFKEAQSYMGPLVIMVIIPVMVALLPGVELKGGWAWVPLTNVALAMKELVKGTMDYFQLIAIFGSTALIALLLLGFCVYWFKQEKVLFR
ncbi:ABC transporter permease [Paraglaciecola polaris]|uniref:Sodium transport system permease protein n=1 Tax=Paraglaciecola polaris LMG 21857 TaxID=1129793 RepID=K6ZHB5_9ALTE|nr:ABC transporter permease [Paraglaciecola polaris]GAC35401.1 sodium transport system permease protein [Paraglaciecola polaris LMG 21857]|tara:strand:+ start:2378 stop:3571 length:1194 start_codon:yes stop_codon:yes gene_type:complete